MTGHSLVSRAEFGTQPSRNYSTNIYYLFESFSPLQWGNISVLRIKNIQKRANTLWHFLQLFVITLL